MEATSRHDHTHILYGLDVKEQSHIAYNTNVRRAYGKSQHAEDFGRIKNNLRFSSHALARD